MHQAKYQTLQVYPKNIFFFTFNNWMYKSNFFYYEKSIFLKYDVHGVFWSAYDLAF